MLGTGFGDLLYYTTIRCGPQGGTIANIPTSVVHLISKISAQASRSAMNIGMGLLEIRALMHLWAAHHLSKRYSKTRKIKETLLNYSLCDLGSILHLTGFWSHWASGPNTPSHLYALTALHEVVKFQLGARWPEALHLGWTVPKHVRALRVKPEAYSSIEMWCANYEVGLTTTWITAQTTSQALYNSWKIPKDQKLPSEHREHATSNSELHLAVWNSINPYRTPKQLWVGQLYDVGAWIIRIGFWGSICYVNIIRNHQK